MIKILFICHGNICRSPMAEFVFKDMVQAPEKYGLSAAALDRFYAASAATSTEEIGNPVHEKSAEAARNFHRGKIRPPDDKKRLQRIRLSHRHGSVEYPEHAADLRGRSAAQNLPAAGFYGPSAGHCGSVVYRRF